MSNTIENPPAFAFGIGTDNYDVQQQGMSLRDYFAAKAMQGIMVGDNAASHYPNTVSEWAYAIADGMLKQRLTPIKENDD